MLKKIAVGITALFVMASPLAFAQTTSERGRLSGADLGALTDMRINIVKAALQLTPDQEKYWPPVESAIRERAKDRQSRIADAANRMTERRDNLAEAIRDRDPVDSMRRHADALSQRGADLKKLANAWQPLYQTLKPDQRQRMAFLSLVVLRDMTNVGEQRRVRFEDDEED